MLNIDMKCLANFFSDIIRSNKIFIRIVAIIFLMAISILAADGTWKISSDEDPCGRSGMNGFIRKSWRRKMNPKMLDLPILESVFPYLCSFEEDYSNIIDENESVEYSEGYFHQQQPSFPRKIIEINLNNLLKNKIKKQLTARDKEEAGKSEPEFRSFMGLRGKRSGV